MRRVDHGVEILDPEHAEIGDREGAALELVELQLAGLGSGAEILHLIGDRREALLVGVLDDRRDKAILERDGDRDVDVFHRGSHRRSTRRSLAAPCAW